MSYAAVSWSGGKDSTLALYKAVLNGFKILYLINMISSEGRSRGHGIRRDLIAAQSRAIGIPVIQRMAEWETYEHEFKTVLSELKRRGVTHVVFGDIDLPEHLDWVKRVCSETGVKPVEPLWNMDPRRILLEFIDAGFKAIVVRVRTDLMGREWLGREIDRRFIDDIMRLRDKVHPCGELGEYHTFVIDGPLFKRRIEIIESRKMSKDGYLSLDIIKYRLVEE